ncbi:MAG: hypothetical protein KME11_06405 [Timaviella obliquedivisa GSE-PSE-MK23-08B]|jgi:hypothetical protein|nr:hypothetical protein [Timaviella obliquedivisa GSE-PSE-MK23-08B]
MVFNFKHPKSKRIAKNIWENVLLKTNQYFSDSQEAMKLSLVEVATYKLRMNSGSYIYPKERAREEIRNFAKAIYAIPEIKNSYSFGTVYESVKYELQSELSFIEESNHPREFEEVLKTLFCRIDSKLKLYDFYFSLEGIKLIGISKIDFGSIQILEFNQEVMNEVLSTGDDTNQNGTYTEFIEKNFLNRVCIRCRCSGDSKSSKKLAELRTRETINYFRYLICLLFYKRIHENLLKINVVSETYVDENQVLAKEAFSGNLSFHWNVTRKPSQDFPVNQERLNEIKEKLYFDEIVRILNMNSNDRAQLEGCLLTAMYWSGEAQNEFDWDISFLKYWTALECIFSHKEKGVAGALARGISALAAFSDYQFITSDEIDVVYSSVKSLYDKRSKIVHRGLRNSVDEAELTEICKYASWTILSLMSLISVGYRDVAQLDAQIAKLYECRPH